MIGDGGRELGNVEPLKRPEWLQRLDGKMQRGTPEQRVSPVGSATAERMQILAVLAQIMLLGRKPPTLESRLK